MNRPYYDQVGYEPRYETSQVLEDVLDDRSLSEPLNGESDDLDEEVLEPK